MNKIVNLEAYSNTKRAKLIVDDLLEILRIMGMTEKLLVPFRKYIPVKATMNEISNNKALLNMYLQKYKKVVEGEPETNK